MSDARSRVGQSGHDKVRFPPLFGDYCRTSAGWCVALVNLAVPVAALALGDVPCGGSYPVVFHTGLGRRGAARNFTRIYAKLCDSSQVYANLREFAQV